MTGAIGRGPDRAAPATGRLSRPTLILHWTVGIVVIGMLAYGFWLRTVPSGPDKTAHVQIHKSVGLLVLALALLRAAWRWREGLPAPAGRHSAFERRSACALHVVLIAATILMPLSGIVRSLAYARPVALFGWPVIPRLFETRQEVLYAFAAGLHDSLALLLAFGIALHAGAGLVHHYRDGDATLSRIFGGGAPREDAR